MIFAEGEEQAGAGQEKGRAKSQPTERYYDAVKLKDRTADVPVIGTNDTRPDTGRNCSGGSERNFIKLDRDLADTRKGLHFSHRTHCERTVDSG